MAALSRTDQEFLEQIRLIITEHISNEQFGVSELATRAGMSRSNLLRKVKKLTNLSVSQFIREERLKQAMELLKTSSYNVSEVSYQVGFGSTSYFIKCFRDYYGFSPGEAGKQAAPGKPAVSKQSRIVLKPPVIVLALLLPVLIILAILTWPGSSREEGIEKSIAVLPFKNESEDASNTHLVNGLMEAVLNNLQRIEDLRVISRTSVEKYRDNPQVIPEIARELNVGYLVEGSGQKSGDRILLNIQLIDAATDRQLWAGQYERKVEDIFALQNEIAQRIAAEVQAVITPEEAARIEKVPTENIEAYDLFLQGREYMEKGGDDNLTEAISLFREAIALDPGFALAHANISLSYYFMDVYQAEKRYTAQINSYADRAMLLDPGHELSLIAKGLYYISSGAYEMAVPYLERGLELNPNSLLLINILSDFYTSVIPNTEKYLEYALKALRLEFPSADSVTTSFSYLHIANAFIQTGFTGQAMQYVKRSLAFNPDNLYSVYVKAYISYAEHRDLNKLKSDLLAALSVDSTRLDIVQEVAKTYYYLRDFETAYAYYEAFNRAREQYKLDIYPNEDAKIAVTCDKVGRKEEAKKYFDRFLLYAEQDHSLYRNLSISAYYAYHGDTVQALNYMELFTNESDFQYWILLFFEMDPLVDHISQLPEFKVLFKKITSTFWDQHEAIRSSLEKQGLI
jgi:TolB-like protein/AraC-like DNA-binding protein